MNTSLDLEFLSLILHCLFWSFHIMIQIDDSYLTYITVLIYVLVLIYADKLQNPKPIYTNDIIFQIWFSNRLLFSRPGQPRLSMAYGLCPGCHF